MSSLLENLEAALLRASVASLSVDHPCARAIGAHFAAGGQRLRARICLDASARLMLSGADGLCIAVVCELLHNASLLQDDLLDRAPARRGQPSVWAAYGDTVAVCSGDLLLASAYAALASISFPKTIASLMALVQRRTGELIAGQVMEMAAAESEGITPRQYEVLARGKSASLLSLALELPLMLSGHAALCSHAEVVADAFAVAYQIADDLEDVEQDAVSHTLNYVAVLREHHRLCRPEAELLAVSRARALLARSVHLSADLPGNCGAVLAEHAIALQARLPLAPLTWLPVPHK